MSTKQIAILPAGRHWTNGAYIVDSESGTVIDLENAFIIDRLTLTLNADPCDEDEIITAAIQHGDKLAMPVFEND